MVKIINQFALGEKLFVKLIYPKVLVVQAHYRKISYKL